MSHENINYNKIILISMIDREQVDLKIIEFLENINNREIGCKDKDCFNIENQSYNLINHLKI